VQAEKSHADVGTLRPSTYLISDGKRPQARGTRNIHALGNETHYRDEILACTVMNRHHQRCPLKKEAGRLPDNKLRRSLSAVAVLRQGAPPRLGVLPAELPGKINYGLNNKDSSRSD
jgi:hypothetical protein